jgi:hypothetical protein
MAEEVTIRITAEDLASGKLSEITGDIDGLGEATEKQGAKAKKSSKKSGLLSGTLGDLEVSSLAAAAGITQLAGFLAQGVDEMVRMEEASTRFEFAMRNAGASTSLMNRTQAQMQANFNRTAFSIMEQERALETLARKTGDAQLANKNLDLAMDLAAATGRDLSDVSKDLAEALTGDINALEEMGVLTEEDTDRLRELEDATERSAGAIEILTGKVRGASGEIDPQVKSVKQMREGWRELNGELSKFALTAGESVIKLITLNEVTNENATATQSMASKVRKATIGLGALVDALEDIELDKKTEEQSDSVLKLMAGLSGLIGNEKRAAEFTRMRLGITEEVTTAQDRMTKAIREHGRESKEAEEAARAYNAVLKDTNELSRDQQRINEGFAGFDFPDLPDPDDEPEPNPDPGPNKEEEYASREEIERRKANIAYEAQQKLDERLKKLAQKRRDREFKAEQEMREEQLEQELSAIDKELQADLDAIDKRRDELDRFSSYADVGRSISEGLSGVDRGAQGVSRLLDQATQAAQVSVDATDAEKEKARQIRRSNERLSRQLNLYGQLAGKVGGLSEGIGELASVSWDFSKAGDASLKALNAVSGAGQAAAGILGKNTKQQAGIQAAFEAAAAVGATALGLTNPAMAPQFFAAAAQHATAAAMYGAVAGGAGSGTSADVSSAGGGGGGSAGAGVPGPPSTNGLVEALSREDRMEGGGQTIIYDFSGATMLESAPATQNRISEATERGRQRTVRAGGRG